MSRADALRAGRRSDSARARANESWLISCRRLIKQRREWIRRGLYGGTHARRDPNRLVSNSAEWSRLPQLPAESSDISSDACMHGCQRRSRELGRRPGQPRYRHSRARHRIMHEFRLPVCGLGRGAASRERHQCGRYRQHVFECKRGSLLIQRQDACSQGLC
jgi:hypothetical protein